MIIVDIEFIEKALNQKKNWIYLADDVDRTKLH
jgi:hypothetical protein